MMAANFDSFDVILLTGPPSVGKTSFSKEHCQESHVFINPVQIFGKDPGLGLRDVGLQIYDHLKQGSKVVIDSENASRKTKTSYISLLRKKIPNLKICILEILPEFGCQQLHWAKEFSSASSAISSRELVFKDASIQKWFPSVTDTEVMYRTGVVDKPLKENGIAIFEKKLPLKTESVYKFEVPALFIQWELLSSSQSPDNLVVGSIVKVLNHWTVVNPCGRVLVMCAGSQIKTGERTHTQLQTEVHSFISQLVKKFTACPVYVLMVCNPDMAGSFVVPPRPGLLAFLQKYHCLNLLSKNTVYLYDSADHLKMAEAAGVRHIKGSRVLDHPNLIVSSVAMVTPPVPSVLEKLEINEDVENKNKMADIPLFHLVDEFSDKFVSKNLGYGRQEFLFAADWDVVERFQSLYSSQASRVGEEKSMIDNQSGSSPVNNNQSELEESSNQQTTSRLNRSHSGRPHVLPKWMQKTYSNSSKSSLDSSRSESLTSKGVSIKKTVYVMTEKELKELARDILKQAGREDLLKQINSENDSPTKKTSVSNDIQLSNPLTPSKCPVAMETESKCVDPDDSTSAKVDVNSKLQNETVTDALSVLLHPSDVRRPSPRKKRRHISHKDEDKVAAPSCAADQGGTDRDIFSDLFTSTLRRDEPIPCNQNLSSKQRPSVIVGKVPPGTAGKGPPVTVGKVPPTPGNISHDGQIRRDNDGDMRQEADVRSDYKTKQTDRKDVCGVIESIFAKGKSDLKISPNKNLSESSVSGNMDERYRKDDKFTSKTVRSKQKRPDMSVLDDLFT